MSNQIDVAHLDILDWDTSLRLAGNQPALAKDMLVFVIDRLPDDLARIKTLHSEGNIPELIKEVHKLHGSLCYCGLPRLKMLIAQLESNLKNNIMIDSSCLLNQFETEVCLLLDQVKYPDHANTLSSRQQIENHKNKSSETS